MSRLAVAAVAALFAFGPEEASAQSANYDLPEKLVDSNGVDLAGGKYVISFPVLRFGDGVRLKLDYFGRYPEFGVPWHGAALDIYSKMSMSSGAEFIESGWSPLGPYAFYRYAGWEVVMPDGQAYSKPAGGAFRTQLHSASYTTPGHRPIGMVDEEGNFWEYTSWIGNVLTEVVRFADGEILTIKREKFPFSTPGARIRHAVSSRGYMIQYEYETESATTQSQLASWQRIAKISAGSLAHNYCDTSGLAVCAAISAAGNSITVSHFANGYEIATPAGSRSASKRSATFRYRFQARAPTSRSKSATGSSRLAIPWGTSLR